MFSTEGSSTRKVNPAEGLPPDLVWPRSLVQRSDRPLLVYLDLNHWIGLAQADSGHRDGLRFQPVLEACREARRSNLALFPLSDAHYVEVTKIKSPQQRKDLAVVMEELSGFTTLLSKPDVMRLEVDVVVAALLESDQLVYPPFPLLGPGVFWAFGRRGLRIRDGEGDITDRVREENPELYWEMFELAEREFLAGPADNEVDELRANGWIPDAGWQVAETRAQQEREQAARFDADDRWRRGRIRDVILARELTIELWDMLIENLTTRSHQVDFLQGDRERARRLVRSMPTSEVATELKVAAHRNAQTKWTPNDIIDIDSMSLSVPYCDIVVTEKRACHTLRSAHLDARMGTTIIDSLGDLPALLAQAASGPASPAA